MKSLENFSDMSESESSKVSGGGLLLDTFGYWGIASAIVSTGESVWSHRNEIIKGYEDGRK